MNDQESILRLKEGLNTKPNYIYSVFHLTIVLIKVNANN